MRTQAHGRELLAVTTKGLGQGAEIEPLQVRFLEVINRMIEVKAVNVAADANHGGLYVAKSPACKAGLSDRTYLPGGICKVRIGRASDRQGVGALGLSIIPRSRANLARTGTMVAASGTKTADKGPDGGVLGN
jgi:hypothetical protein